MCFPKQVFHAVLWARTTGTQNACQGESVINNYVCCHNEVHGSHAIGLITSPQVQLDNSLDLKDFSDSSLLQCLIPPMATSG